MPIRKALLLDLDDTIIDDSGNVERCWRDACLVHGSELQPLDPCALFDAIERQRRSEIAVHEARQAELLRHVA